ncbi:MAG: hypothetical protein GY832_10370, partial [Chloroflexi bacterium]|nr:hypothetical protein [Chloroflexota bacterium]
HKLVLCPSPITLAPLISDPERAYFNWRRQEMTTAAAGTTTTNTMTTSIAGGSAHAGTAAIAGALMRMRFPEPSAYWSIL